MRWLSIAAFAVGIGCQAASSAEPACGAFTLIGGDKGVSVVDNPPAGKSAGDLRAGWRRLADEDGNPQATVHYSVVLTEPDAEGGDILAGDYFIRFEDGFVAAHTVYQLPDAAETSQKARSAILAVTAGRALSPTRAGRWRSWPARPHATCLRSTAPDFSDYRIP